MIYFVTLPIDAEQRSIACSIVTNNGGRFLGCSDFTDSDGSLQVEGMTNEMREALQGIGLNVFETNNSVPAAEAYEFLPL